MYSDERLLSSLEMTITALDEMTAVLMANLPPFSSNPYRVFDQNGMPVFAPIIIARAQAFAAYTALKIDIRQREQQEKMHEAAALRARLAEGY